MTQQSTASRWLRTYIPRPHAQARVVFLPHAGGNASAFLPFVRSLPPSIEGVVVQYPGRMDRPAEEWEGDLLTACRTIADAITTLADRPFGLCGHSMGAVLAFEIAAMLTARGVEPAHLFVSGRPAPHRARVSHHYAMGDDHLWDEVARLGGTPAEVLELKELRDYLLPALRADYELVETFRPVPRERFDWPVTVFTGDRDPEVDEEEARAWSEVSTGLFALHFFEGDHFYLTSHIGPITDALARALATARTEDPR